jgi:hypothetical protein
MIQSEELPARKVAGRWMIEADDLPLTTGQREAVARKERQLRSAVEEGLGITEDGERKPRYSLRDLKAFQIVLPIYRQTAQTFGEGHPAATSLRKALDQLSLGCHRFERQHKIEAYRQARDFTSLAVCELALAETAEAETLINALEQNLMAALAGLLRKMEGGRNR